MTFFHRGQLKHHLYPRVLLALLLSITLVLIVVTVVEVERSQKTLSEELVKRGQHEVQMLGNFASVYFGQEDYHQLTLIGRSAVNDGQGLFVAFYSPQGELLATAAAPSASEAARTSFQETVGQVVAGAPRAQRSAEGYIEIVERFVYQGNPAGIVALRLGTEELQQERANVLRQSVMTATAIGVVLLFVVGILLRRLVIRPLQRIDLAAQAISAGDFSRQAEVVRDDEIGRLATSFNTMTAHVKQTLAELEQRVEERTEELKKALDMQTAQATELEEAKLAAEESSRLKSQFLANMSHELRTPLNAIIGFTDLMITPRFQVPEKQEYLQQRLMANAEHLLGLISDILDLSKIEAGKLDLRMEETDLQAILNGVMSTAIGLTKDKGLRLELEVEPGLPTVWIDKTRIRQVLLNLLSNAAKFTEQGCIRVRAEVVENDFVRIAVQDQGIGIAPEHHGMVFEEFRQIEGELHRQYQGTGLGLPICKRLVEMHGGQIWLESTLGQGSTFFFTTPTVARATAAPSEAQVEIAE